MTPDAAPPDVSADQAALYALITSIADAVENCHEDLSAEVQQTVVGPLREAFEHAASTHAEAAEHLGEPAAPDAERRAVIAYREAVIGGVLAPLRELLAEASPGSRIPAAADAAADRMSELVMTLPETISRPEPAKLYAGGSGSPVDRLRKTAIRAGRRGRALQRRVGNALRRLVGSEAEDGDRFIQHVPLLQLATYHTAVRVPELQRGVVTALHQRLGRTIIQLERSLAAWLPEIIQLEEVLDDAGTLLPDGPDSVASSGEGESALARARRSMEELQRSLDSLAPLVESIHLRKELHQVAQHAHAAFEADIDDAGSFQLDLEKLKDGGAADTQADGWKQWYRQAVTRLDLQMHILQFRESARLLATEEARSIVAAAVAPPLQLLERAAARLRELEKEAEAVCDDLVRDEEALAASLRSLRDRAGTFLEEELFEPWRAAGFGMLADETARTSSEEMLSLLSRQPDEFVLHLLEEQGEDQQIVGGDLRRVRFREIAEQAYDALLVERMRRAADPVVAALEHASTEAGQILMILQFNLDAAVDELSGASQAAGRDPVASARELARNGFDRSAATLTTVADELSQASLGLATLLFITHREGFNRLYERVRSEGRVQEQLLDLRTGLRLRGRSTLERTAALLRNAATVTRRISRLGRRRARTLVHMGRKAVGADAPSTAGAAHTLDAIAGVDVLLDRFPLVYRRLFSFQPLTDPSLLERRERDLSATRRHFERWQRGLAGAFIVTGFYGNGLSSFINVAMKTVLDEVDPLRITLEARLDDEALLVRKISEAFGETDIASAATLDEAVAGLLARPAGGTPMVCIVEHLEHLLLRTVGGSRLLTAFLTFMSRTDSRVLWIATVGEHAWRFVEKTSPIAASLVATHVLEPLDREGLRAIILNRHRRSGLPLVFEIPSDLNPLQRRQLRRARDERERQDLLRDDFFRGLFRLSGQNIMLALFYWLHSAQLDELTSSMHVRPLRSFSFAFLESFPISHAFSLKAMLQHGSLTLEEHARVFQSTPQQSFQVFEALHNHLLIEPHPGPSLARPFEKNAIQSNVRYRIRPLIVHPVLEYLRGRHIVY